jgi:hypothetical protein
MSVVYAKLELTKGNRMEMGIRELTELVRVKTDLTEIGSYAYALSLVWSFADDKLKNQIVRLIEENNQ